ESIHVNFDELPYQALVHNSSDPALTRHSKASAHNSTDPGPSRQSMASVQNSTDLGPTCQRMASVQIRKQPSRATTPIEPTDLQRTEAEQLKIVLKRSKQETHISQQSGSGTGFHESSSSESSDGTSGTPSLEPVPSPRSVGSTVVVALKGCFPLAVADSRGADSAVVVGEGTGSKPGVPVVPSDDSEEELLWKSSDDEDVGSHEEGKESDESNDDSDEGSDNDSDETVKSGASKDNDDDDDEDDDDNDDEEELAKDDEEDKAIGESDEEQEEEESFDPIPRTPEESEEESNDEEEQESRLSEEARIQEEEDADEFPRIPNQPFADMPTEEEVLDFLRFLGHSQDIHYLTDVNVNKLYQPWRSFASVINKCLTGKSSGVDSFRLSQAQML
nr:hypothetical protein [Tanacetum cinerariifolium]